MVGLKGVLMDKNRVAVKVETRVEWRDEKKAVKTAADWVVKKVEM